jgi:capsid protein
VRSGFASEVEVIRRRSQNPRDVLEQIETFRKEADGKGLVFDSNAKNTSGAGAAQSVSLNSAANDNGDSARNDGEDAAVDAAVNAYIAAQGGQS